MDDQDTDQGCVGADNRKGQGLEGNPRSIFWGPSSLAASHKTFAERLTTLHPRPHPHLTHTVFLLPAFLKINASVRAAEKSPEQRLTPGAARVGLALGGWGLRGGADAQASQD